MAHGRISALLLLTVALSLAPVAAFADRDAVQFGSDIHVAKDGSVHDAVCFFCSVDAQGEIKGDVVVFFGNVRIAGRADHDVVNFFGKVKTEDDVVIGGDLVSMFGTIRMGENGSVGKDMVAMFGAIQAPDSVTVAGNRVAQPLWVFLGPLLLVGGIVVFVLHEIRIRQSRRFPAYPYPPTPQR
jgi:hypothetical protein